MPKRLSRHQLGRFWLYQRPDSKTWSICCFDKPVGSTRAVLRRKATPFAGGAPDKPPEGAIEALEAHWRENGRETRLKPHAALLEAIIADWLTHHVVELAAPERYQHSARLWLRFFNVESKAGRMPPKPTVTDVSPGMVRRFTEARRNEGVGGHTISRDLAALRGALNWAWKAHRIQSAPFIPDVRAEQKAPPRSRVLSFEEIGRMLEACVGRPEREHIIRFIVIELGTAGRPQAVLELTHENVDLERGLIDPNRPDRQHLRKRRAVVPIASHVLPWVTGIRGKLIRYSVPLSERNIKEGASECLQRSTNSIKTAWRAICRDAGVVNATPKTLRHTMLTWLAVRGVPKEQRMAFAGHAPRDTTASNYEHLTPQYLRAAVLEVDQFFVALKGYTSVLR